MERENEYLKELMELEDLAEKKTRIYARLFVEPALAKEMELLSAEHEKHKTKIEQLFYGESRKKGKKSVLHDKESGE